MSNGEPNFLYSLSQLNIMRQFIDESDQISKYLKHSCKTGSSENISVQERKSKYLSQTQYVLFIVLIKKLHFSSQWQLDRD